PAHWQERSPIRAIAYPAEAWCGNGRCFGYLLEKQQMNNLITGKAYVLGDNVDTDQIIPAQYLTFNPSIPEEYRMFGKYALSSVPPAQAGLPKGHVPFHEGDEFVSPYKVIVAGRNFGCGSSR